MSRERFQQVAAIFEQVSGLPPADRTAFLDEACGNDSKLREEVESLLQRHDCGQAGGRFDALERDVRDQAEALTAAQPSPTSPRSIGRYEIRSVIATGGMGTVYEAVQDHPHRRVALKLMRRGMASRSALQRFRHETEILGRLQHPNIGQIFDAGKVDEGEGAQPYFAMEFVRGRPLIEHCDALDLGTRDRLALFVKVCDAVQYAHQQGVIHRDLKPDNILVDDHGEPKILDFGIARATDADIQATTLRTDIGQLIGTVPYMSPEQATGDPHQLDTRSDVYSLGVILYEILCGRLPHDLRDKNIPEAVRVIREEDPTPLSSVNRVFRGDLETIAAKALEKEKNRRYQSPAELAADIRHYLTDEPIVARPASTFYQLRKFARRNRVLVAGIAAVMLVLTLGTVVSTAGFWQANRQRQGAEDEAEKAAIISEFLSQILTSADPDAGRREMTVAQLLGEAGLEIDGRFAAYPEVTTQLHLTVGTAYWRLGRHDDAETHLRAAWAQGRHLDDPALAVLTLDALARLAAVYNDKWRHADAIAQWREVLVGRREILGTTHPDTLAAMAGLGRSLHYAPDPQGRARGESMLREALDLSTRLHGSDAQVTFDVTFALENFLLMERRLAEAEPLARWMVQWCRDKPGAEGTLAVALTELGYLVGWLGNPAEGARMTMQACEIQRRNRGLGASPTRDSLYAAGLNLQWDGRLEEAERYFREFEAAFYELGWEINRKPWRAEFFIARVQMLRGTLAPEEAQPTFEAFLAEDKVYHNLGVTAYVLCLVRQGLFQDAELALEQYEWRHWKSMSADHYERRLHLSTLVELYEGLGNEVKAAEYRVLLREAEEIEVPD